MKNSSKFKVLLCGKKELLLGSVRKAIVESDVHVQYVSSADFLIGRAIFNIPQVVYITLDDHKESIEVLKDFLARFPEVPVYGISASITHEQIVDSIKAGAKDYYILPADQRKWREVFRDLLDKWRNNRHQKEYVDVQRQTFDFSQIIGKSSHLLDTIKRAKKAIENPLIDVLITGETGTGKELMARAVHFNGISNSQPFVDIACSALPETLLEAELFGYEKGAFTDARDKKIGLFELAGEGTIFLDEIGDISRSVQSKLLKVLESHTMRRLGGLRDIPVKARIIAATSADLEAKMRAGEFRRDLYHRLNILPLQVPPLRDRKEDIPVLVNAFIKQFNEMYGKNIRGMLPATMSALLEYRWEGNVRELRHCIERGVLLEEEEWLDHTHLDLPNLAHAIVPTNGDHGKSLRQTIILTIPFNETSLQSLQQNLARQILSFVGGNKRKASQVLKISRPRLDRILAEEENE
ncbi:MAG TPA: sigma-54 dependent transcriptional regulator [Bacteroidota bacterium]|nr:sigma-54 dependent transcriptional regulator [Bacteroidota bacterium]